MIGNAAIHQHFGFCYITQPRRKLNTNKELSIECYLNLKGVKYTLYVPIRYLKAIHPYSYV